MTDLIYSLVIAVLGIVIGYLLKRPGAKELIERVKVERVNVPQIVEKIVEKVRVEYVDKPVVVEKPTLKVERVEVPYVVEKEKTIVERAPAAAMPATVRFARPKGTPMVIKLLSNSGREIGEHTIDDTERKPSMQVRIDGLLCNLVASHQDESGQWFYRRVGVERE